MHPIDLAQLAGTFIRATHAHTTLRLAPRQAASQAYWLAARYRHENWMHELSRHRHDIARAGASRRGRLWQAILPTIQDVLLSEPLARTVAYQSSVWDQTGIDRELAPLAISTLTAHVEARNRCLHLIVFGQGLAVEYAVKLNRLRRTLETYTDQLLSWLPTIEQPGLIAFDPDTVAKQHAQLRWCQQFDISLPLHTLSLAEHLWKELHRELDWRTSSARLNYQISQHVLGLLAADSFDGLGLPRSLRNAQLLNPSLESLPKPDQHPLFNPTVDKVAYPHRWSSARESRPPLRDN